jgi:hypothetical protein
MQNKPGFISAALIFLSLLNFACQRASDGQVKAENKVPAANVSPQPEPVFTPRLDDIPGIFGELEKRNAGDPQMTEDKLAELGNELVQKMGYTFYVDVTDFKEPKENKYTFTGLDGKAVEFVFDEVQPGPCFTTLNLPVEKINAKEITIVKDGVQYAVKRPKGFYTEEFALVDKALKKVIRKWAAPIDATPVGISDDGKKIYFTFAFGMEPDPRKKQPSVEEMLSEMSEDGTMRFVTKNDPRVNKGKELEGYPAYSEISYRRFVTKDNTEYIVKFSYPCT